MSIRRNSSSRLTLLRVCRQCGKSIVTTAESPFMRSVRGEDGKYKTAYFCSESCKKASYTYNMDGLAWKRREARNRARDRSEWWEKYYAENGEKIRARRRERYQENREQELLANEYARKKRKLLAARESV